MKSLVATGGEYVSEVKGPGQVIGEVGLDNSTTSTYKQSARARDNVVVVKLTEENYAKALLAAYGIDKVCVGCPA